ncbi:Uncharacterized conserved protein YehS, DUF1456 family [Marivirga sericea]|uniref:Uncharacterized conserved protein YehS, DUF1456 family n=1 Tax=Marivirga sericea TaxID=1028 RepID=A0A1X7KEW8_9BACT|nr:DUF1456 family protein [Marivirga sericea]SMG39661.1 Uncharacterized conserved protein YehS, DUF1456 family [Marivirga sericea]
MTNNDILKRIRYTFDFSDEQMMAIFESADYKVTRSLVTDWLKNDDHADYKDIHDDQLATFLNGLINEKRGKRDGEQPKPEKILDNNTILKKLKIALTMRTEDIAEVFKLAGKPIGQHEITAFLRNSKQSQYRPFLDQYLRNFLNGLQLKYRGNR